jgi:hypothetical protein
MTMKKYAFISLLLIFLGQYSLAQFQVIPLPKVQNPKPSAAKVAALSLPFFDDFSTSFNTQDPTKWEKNGGVFINNTFTTNHPTLNVATFDGLKADGNPYDFSNSFATGTTDTLTSLSIDLSKNNLSDSLYLSFYYMAQGLGERPDTQDSLRVQFYTNGGKWETVWVDSGKVISNKFIQKLIPIRRQIYLHGDFKFRFQAFGRRSGQFDVWHIDYVYLDKFSTNSVAREYDRTTKTISFTDYAFQSPISSVLKKYNAMPLNQFLVNPEREQRDSVKANIFSLRKSDISVAGTLTLRNLINNQTLVISKTGQGANIIVPALSNQITNINLKNPLAEFLKNEKSSRAVVKMKFEMDTQDFFRMNDTTSRTLVLDNYYAYDDGSAEQAAFLKKGFGRTMVQFILNKPDAVTGVNINFQPTITNLTGKRFTLQLLSNKNNKPDRILKTISDSTITVRYPNTPNGFVQYKIDSVAVVDTFYVGYVQLADDEPLVVGLDANSPEFSNRHFYNISNEWVNVTDAQRTSTFVPIKGSLMIRPVMAGKEIKQKPLATEEEIAERNLVVSPNPSSGIFRWNNATLKDVEVFDILGKSLLQVRTDNQEVNLQHLNTGMYFLRLSNEKDTFVRKIIKE